MIQLDQWILESDRIKMVPLALCDAPFILELLNTPDWLKYIGDRNVRDEASARNYLRTGPLKSYEDKGFGLLKIQLLENAQPVGLCGILKRDFLEHPDLGFALLPEFYGRGLALESCQLVLNGVRANHLTDKVFAFTDQENIPSQKLLRKLGFQFEKEFNPFSKDEWLNLFSLTL